MILNKKIKIGIIVILIFHSSLLIASGGRLVIQPEDESDFECEAIVTSSDIAKFVFKEEEKYPNTVLWERNNLPSAIANTWLVFFQLENEDQDDIDIKLHFITNRSDTKEVKFIDLLNDAKKVSYSYHDDGYFTPNDLNDNDLSPSLEDNDLIFTLGDKEIISLLLDNKPSTANFWILEKNKKVRNCVTNIKYILTAQNN